MNDLIRRRAVFNELKGLYIAPPKITNDMVWDSAIDTATDKIKDLPSVDAVEVVRCKDCVNSDWYTTTDGRHLCYCMVHGNGGHKETDFCSDGERETDETD